MNAPPDSPPSDADALFQRAQAGDPAAWNELFRTCHPKLLRAVRRRLEAPMRTLYDSTDIAGDVWKSLIAKADRFDFPTLDHFLGFLAKAAEQKIVDEYRRMHAQKNDVDRERRLDADADGEASPQSLASHDPTPSAVVSANEGLELFRGRCTPQELQVVDLRLAHLENAEIAPRLGMNLRALQRILKRLGDSWTTTATGRTG